MRFRTRIATVSISAAFVAATLGLAPAAHAGTVTCNVHWTNGLLYAGHYDGDQYTPSTTQVTAAGEEAQCLLQAEGWDVGTIDGVFGPKSQAAMKQFQSYQNEYFGHVLTVDGICGPKSWPYLREDAGGSGN